MAKRKQQIEDSGMTTEQTAVLNLLISRMQKGDGKITQYQIATTEPKLGYHGKYEEHLKKASKLESTLRKVRSIIEELRRDFNYPILSDCDGYWLEYKSQEARDEYLAREEASIDKLIETLQAKKLHMARILSPNPDHDDVDPVVPSAQTDYSEYEFELEMFNFPSYDGYGKREN